MQQHHNVLLILAPLSVPDDMHDHIPDLLNAVLLL
jgi:hypothetical protein